MQVAGDGDDGGVVDRSARLQNGTSGQNPHDPEPAEELAKDDHVHVYCKGWSSASVMQQKLLSRKQTVLNPCLEVF
jgi:hypothetical protein